MSDRADAMPAEMLRDWIRDNGPRLRPPADLEPRKLEEATFHDADRAAPDTEVPSNRIFYSVTSTSQGYVDEWLRRSVPGKVFLDYGAGDGRMSIRAARFGAALAVGVEISAVSVEKARRLAAAAGVGERCLFVHGDCEATGLPSNTFDVALCSGMLHHVDLDVSFRELGRLAKPGGRVLGIEALAHNPAFTLYRRLTPHLRTAWETDHILKKSDLKRARPYFAIGNVRHWHLLNLAAVPLARWPRLQRRILNVLNPLDTLLLRLPGIRNWSWQVSFELIRADAPPASQAHHHGTTQIYHQT